MFTGIIREIGFVSKKTPLADGSVCFSFESKILRPKPGQSIAVNGVCLTVTKKTKTGFEADVVAETLQRTNLGALKTGAFVNLEPSLTLDSKFMDFFSTSLGLVGPKRVLKNGKKGGRVSSEAKTELVGETLVSPRFDGHFVTGHVDSTCRILKKGKIQHGVGFAIELPKRLAPFVAEKGSVTLNGVSLTVAAVTKNSFTVALIPFTQKNTNLGSQKKGDMVNLEIDILARYAYRNYHLAIQ